MNRRIKPMSLLAAILLCLIAVGCFCPAALAADTAAPPAAGETAAAPATAETAAPPAAEEATTLPAAAEAAAPPAADADPDLILVPIRSKTLEKADAANAVLAELPYALHILRYSDTRLTFVPLQADTTKTVYTTVENVLASDTAAYEDVLTADVDSIQPDLMELALSKTQTALTDQLNKLNKTVPVIILQYGAYGFLPEQVQEIWRQPNADVVLLFIRNDETPEKLGEYLRVLGFPDATASLTADGLTTLAPRLRVMEIAINHPSTVYEALEPLLLAASTQESLALAKAETSSTVLLPAKGAADVLLILKNIPEGASVVVTDESGTAVNPVNFYMSGSQAIYELANVGGKLTVAASAPQPAAEQTPTAAPAADETQTAEPAAEGTVEPAAQAQPPAGETETAAAQTPPLTELPAAETAAEPPATAAAVQPVPGVGVEGTLLFSFHCTDTMQLTTQTGETVFPKKQPIALILAPQGDILSSVITQDLGVELLLKIKDSQGVEISQTVTIGGDGRSIPIPVTLQKSGAYTVWAELRIGDFYTAASNILTLTANNLPPTAEQAKTYDFWIDDPFDADVEDLRRIDLSTLFTDPDQDGLTYRLSMDANGTFADSLAVDSFADLSIVDGSLQLASPVAGEPRTVYVEADDGDGGATVLALPITFHSVYDTLKAVTLGEPLFSSATAAKYAQVLISVKPGFPLMTSEDSLVRQLFLKQAAVTCLLVQGNSVSTTLPMTYDAQTDTYQVLYPMPDTAVEYSVTAAYEIAMPADDAVHLPLTGESPAATLTSINTEPRWIGAVTDGGDAAAPPPPKIMEDKGNGELYDLALDFAEYFQDNEDALLGVPSNLTGFVWVTGSGNRSYTFEDQGSGVFLLTEHKAEAGLPPVLMLKNAGQVTIRFQTAGHYTIHLAAADPDGLAVIAPGLAKPSEPTASAPGSMTLITPENAGAVEANVQSVTAPDSLATPAPENAGAAEQSGLTWDELTNLPNGTLFIEVISPKLELFKTIGFSAAAALALLILVLAVIRLLKPAFGNETLQLSLQTSSLQAEWAVPLSAWKKRAVPLQWMLLYGCVPPLAELKEMENAVVIHPSRQGIMIVTKQKTLQWVSGPDTLPRTFVQTDAQPPVTLRQAEFTLTLSLQNENRRKPV